MTADTDRVRAATRSAASRRGARRRQLRQRLRDDVLLRLVEYGGPDLLMDEQRDRDRELAKWVAYDALPDYVIDAIEAHDARR